MLASFSFGTLLLAAPFWDKKDFAKWTTKDAKKILTDSPWAKSVRLNMTKLAKEISEEQVAANEAYGPGPRITDSYAADNNGPQMSGGGAGQTGSMGQGRGTGQTGGAQQPSMGSVPPGEMGQQQGQNPQAGEREEMGPRGASATLEWESATPMRLAELKITAGESRPSQADVAQAEKPTDVYVVALVGIPGKPQTEEEKEMATAATITPKNKQSIQATDVQEQSLSNGTRALIFKFPKNKQISLDDGTVEFHLVKGALPIEVKQNFKLKDMLYKGKLAL